MLNTIFDKLQSITRGHSRSGASARVASESNQSSPWFGNSPKAGAISASFTEWQYGQGQEPYDNYGDEAYGDEA